MADKQEILDNHGNITQSGDIIVIKKTDNKNKLFNYLFAPTSNKFMRELPQAEFFFALVLRVILFFFAASLVTIPFIFDNHKVSDVGFSIGFFILISFFYFKIKNNGN